jgi:hypothetical protein
VLQNNETQRIIQVTRGMLSGAICERCALAGAREQLHERSRGLIPDTPEWGSLKARKSVIGLPHNCPRAETRGLATIAAEGR